jgi:hypothetical protein
MAYLHPSLYRYNYQASTNTQTWETIPLDSREAKKMINQGISISIIKNALYKKNKQLIADNPKEGLDK